MATTTGIMTPGRIAFLIGNLGYSIGAYFFDWNETHGKSVHR